MLFIYLYIFFVQYVHNWMALLSEAAQIAKSGPKSAALQIWSQNEYIWSSSWLESDQSQSDYVYFDAYILLYQWG